MFKNTSTLTASLATIFNRLKLINEQGQFEYKNKNLTFGGVITLIIL